MCQLETVENNILVELHGLAKNGRRHHIQSQKYCSNVTSFFKSEILGHFSWRVEFTEVSLIEKAFLCYLLKTEESTITIKFMNRKRKIAPFIDNSFETNWNILKGTERYIAYR